MIIFFSIFYSEAWDLRHAQRLFRLIRKMNVSFSENKLPGFSACAQCSLKSMKLKISQKFNMKRMDDVLLNDSMLNSNEQYRWNWTSDWDALPESNENLEIEMQWPRGRTFFNIQSKIDIFHLLNKNLFTCIVHT